MSTEILLVDKDKAFATILKEGLEATGSYRVTVTVSGQAALDHLSSRSFDLVIVDMGIEDIPSETLISSFHERMPGVPVMVIPFFGGQLPPGLAAGEVQGILPKPFFVEDLPALMAQVLQGNAAQESAPIDEPLAAFPAVAASPADSRDAGELPAMSGQQSARTQAPAGEDYQAILKELSRELSAEAVLMIVDEELVAWAGTMAQERVSQLADQVAETVKLSGRTAIFLGEPSEGFEQTLYEGSRFRLLSLRLSTNPQVYLCLALSSDTPLGAIRYRARQTAQEILALLS